MPHDISTSGLPADAVTELTSLYLKVMQQLRAIVADPPGTETGREFRRARAASLAREVDRLVRILDQDVETWIRTNIPKSYQQGIKTALSQLKSAGVKSSDLATRGSFNVVDRRAAEIFARDIASDLRQASASMARRTKKMLRQTAEIGLSSADLDRILAGGLITGKPTQTIRTLREELRAIHGDRITVVGKSGKPMDFKVGYYAGLVVRTKTREATVAARHQRLQENGMDLVMIIGRVSENFCTAFLGQVFSISGKHPNYPALSNLPGGGPPFHPQCSKSTRPWVEDLVGKSERRKAEILTDAQTLFSQDPTTAQRMFRDLGLKRQVTKRYETQKSKSGVIGV